MRNVKKMILFSFLVLSLLLIGSVWFYIKYSEEEILPTNTKTLILSFTNEKKIYVRTKVWGISGNHEEIVFSETPVTIPNKETDYIFYTNEVLYKTDSDVLTIYAPLCNVDELPTPFKGVKVIFNGLKTTNEISDYSINYKKYGLQKISVYDE